MQEWFDSRLSERPNRYCYVSISATGNSTSSGIPMCLTGRCHAPVNLDSESEICRGSLFHGEIE